MEIRFDGLESLAEYLGYYYTEDIYPVAEAEGFYAKDANGDTILDVAAMNDFLKRFGADIRVTVANITDAIVCAKI